MEEFYNSPTWKKPFLENEGSEYAEPFKALRMKYLLLHNHDVKILQTDNLIPESWLHEAYKEQWLHLLNIDANKDMGYVEMKAFYSFFKKIHKNCSLKQSKVNVSGGVFTGVFSMWQVYRALR